MVCPHIDGAIEKEQYLQTAFLTLAQNISTIRVRQVLERIDCQQSLFGPLVSRSQIGIRRPCFRIPLNSTDMKRLLAVYRKDCCMSEMTLKGKKKAEKRARWSLT